MPFPSQAASTVLGMNVDKWKKWNINFKCIHGFAKLKHEINYETDQYQNGLIP